MVEEKGLAVEDQFSHDHSESKDVLLLSALKGLSLLLALLGIDQNLWSNVGKSIAWRVIYINQKILGFFEHTSWW